MYGTIIGGHDAEVMAALRRLQTRENPEMETLLEGPCLAVSSTAYQDDWCYYREGHHGSHSWE